MKTCRPTRRRQRTPSGFCSHADSHSIPGVKRQWLHLVVGVSVRILAGVPQQGPEQELIEAVNKAYERGCGLKGEPLHIVVGGVDDGTRGGKAEVC